MQQWPKLRAADTLQGYRNAAVAQTESCRHFTWGRNAAVARTKDCRHITEGGAMPQWPKLRAAGPLQVAAMQLLS